MRLLVYTILYPRDPVCNLHGLPLYKYNLNKSENKQNGHACCHTMIETSTVGVELQIPVPAGAAALKVHQQLIRIASAHKE